MGLMMDYEYPLVIKHCNGRSHEQMEVFMGKSLISMVHFPARHVGLPEGRHLMPCGWIFDADLGMNIAHTQEPLINLYITMENHHVSGKTHYKWPLSIVISNYQRVNTGRI